MKLAKFEIKSFSDNKFEQDAKKHDFTLPINPESFTRNLKVERETTKAQGNNHTNPKFTGTAPEELKIDFILDGTNTIEGYLEPLNKQPVKIQLKAFLDCVYKYDGNIHSPRYLKIHYGSEIQMDCVLTSADINYTLFHPDGSPLRARITASFLQYVSPEKRVKKQRDESPDLTHLRLVKEGDRLDFLTFKTYDNPKYVLQVALKNDLTTIRTIKPGLELLFYPFNKTEA